MSLHEIAPLISYRPLNLGNISSPFLGITGYWESRDISNKIYYNYDQALNAGPSTSKFEWLILHRELEH